MTNNKIKPQRIGIDARFYGPIGKGLGRYTQEIVDNILHLDPINEYVIFLRKKNFDGFKTGNKKVKKVLADVRWYTFAEQILMPYYIWRERLDLIHFPHFNVPIFCLTKFVVTIHDLILIRFPTSRATTLGPFIYKIKNIAYRIVIKNALMRAQRIIAVSQFTKNDIIEVFKISSEKITVTYEGVANLAKNKDTRLSQDNNDKNTLLRYNISKPFLLYVGNAYPHKNLERLINVFKKINEQGKPETKDLQLVLVGEIDYFYEKVRNFTNQIGMWQVKKKNNNIIFPGYVPDRELEVLYRNAQLYVFPSFYEGFGLPPLEAMANGCSVVSSNRSSMPEILGSAAIYFNPEDQEDMKNKIITLITDKNLKMKLEKRGSEQARKYNWQECARLTYEIYRKLLTR